MQFGRIDAAARTKAVGCALLVFVVASQATGQYDGRSAGDVVEGPRVERMHPEVSSDCMDSNCLQNSEGPVGAMWFGPRLGRRRRSEYKYSPKKLEALGEILASSNYGFGPDRTSNDLPSSLLARSLSGDDKRQDGTFTPRLGRELEEAASAYGLVRNLLNRVDEQTDGKDGSDQQQQPPMIPGPRLGRNLRNLLRRLQM